MSAATAARSVNLSSVWRDVVVTKDGSFFTDDPPDR